MAHSSAGGDPDRDGWLWPGDEIWISPGEKHWHDAAATTTMKHITIQEYLDGKDADWIEKVSDEQTKCRIGGS